MIFRRLLRSMVATRETYVGFKSDTVISNAEFLYLAYGFELLKTEHEMDYQDALVTSQRVTATTPKVDQIPEFFY